MVESPPQRGPSCWPWAGLVLFGAVLVALAGADGLVTLGTALACGATAVGLVLWAGLWRNVSLLMSPQWLGRAIGRPRVLLAALMYCAVLVVEQARTRSPTVLVCLGLLTGLCAGVAWAALMVRLRSCLAGTSR